MENLTTEEMINVADDFITYRRIKNEDQRQSIYLYALSEGMRVNELPQYASLPIPEKIDVLYNLVLLKGFEYIMDVASVYLTEIRYPIRNENELEAILIRMAKNNHKIY